MLDFYDRMYGERGRALARVWKWLSRPGFRDEAGPIVALHDGRIVAHLALVPTRVSFDGQLQGVIRGCDLAVLPEMRGKGLAILLLRKRMEISTLHIGWPNEKAVGIYWKTHWNESRDSYLHFFLLRPFDHPRFIGSVSPALRGTLNAASRQLLGLPYHRYASSVKGLSPVSPTPASLAGLVTNTAVPSGVLQSVHDEEYLRWRLIESPEAPRYKIFNVGDFAMAVKLCEKRGHKYIDLLCVPSGCSVRDIRLLVSTLAIWGMREGYSYLRYYTNSRSVTRYLRWSLWGVVKRTNFVFYSSDRSLVERVQKSQWHLELIEGDFEEF
ncbi:MAG: GNAT family N-acetyltransferase [Candidatus Eisenbacteria bacterium]|nr:GNAT family N-acetyltransferase [Candidatus Eisenbacteria bacterium]